MNASIVRCQRTATCMHSIELLMPINYLASLTASSRSARANLHLGTSLAFVAGALNAGGFLAIGQYTSHMTGMVSSAADNLILGEMAMLTTAVLSLLSFVLGAAATALMVNFARRNDARKASAPPVPVGVYPRGRVGVDRQRAGQNVLDDRLRR